MSDLTRLRVDQHHFFLTYRETFRSNCAQLCRIMDERTVSSVAQHVDRLYSTLFMNAEAGPATTRPYGALSHIGMEMDDLHELLERMFIILLRAFGAHCFRNRIPFSYVNALSDVLNAQLSALEHRVTPSLDAKDSGAWISRLSSLQEGGHAIHMWNNYKGLPVCKQVRLILNEFEQGLASFSLPEPQATLLHTQGFTYLYCELMEETIVATVQSVDVSRGVAVLGDLGAAGFAAKQRKEPRLQPREPTKATIFFEDRKVECQLADLSLMGAGVITLDATWARRDLAVMVEVTLPVPPVPEVPLMIHGVVRGVQGDTPPFTVGLKIHAGKGTEQRLRNYLRARQAEIMAELKHHTRSAAQECSELLAG